MILDKIVKDTRIRVNEAKEKYSLEELIKDIEKFKINDDFPFEKAINNGKVNFICEVKKASPSKGIICEDFDPIKIAKEYEEAGADCISVLTEPKYFHGRDEYLKDIKMNVNIPILRKDFTIDIYQIYEAKLLGADCILLICAILSDNELKRFLELARSLGLSALVETHDEEEVQRAIKAGAKLIGVNNRNLKTFEVDINNSLRLRKLVSKDILFVSESGISSRKQIKDCQDVGVNAVLIGETFMKAKDKKKMLMELVYDKN